MKSVISTLFAFLSTLFRSRFALQLEIVARRRQLAPRSMGADHTQTPVQESRSISPGVGGQQMNEEQAITARVGIDFGGVIVRNQKRVRSEDTRLAGSENAEVAQHGLFDAIREIISICDGHVWIISKAGPRMQARTLAWLNAVDFFSRTGLDPEHVRFCAEREEKEAICRELGLSHFVDDHVHVMQILRHAVPHLYFFRERGGERFCPPWATLVSSWPEVVELLTSSLSTDCSIRE